MKQDKPKILIMFGFLALILGAIAGVIIWGLLNVMDLAIDFIWDRPASLVYNLAVCCSGAVCIGLWQKKYGIYPDSTEKVIAIIKTRGRYPYDKLGVLAVSALLPLIFGGALGPEAGLIGIIAGLCFWVGDSLKKRGHEVSEAMAETGVAVAFSVIFGAPLMGIVGNLEPDGKDEKYREKLLSKKGRIVFYFLGAFGGFGAMKACSQVFADLIPASSGLPRFQQRESLDLSQWKWALMMMVAGIILGLIYCSFEKITRKCAAKIEDKRILSCLIAAVVLAFAGFWLPETMFSGEDALGDLIVNWDMQSPKTLMLIALVKLLLVNVCISFGWRGGHIFPVLYSGASAAFSLALLVGADGTFAAAILMSAMHSYIGRKPVMTVAIMALCFPLTYLPPMLIAAIVARKIPSPFANS